MNSIGDVIDHDPAYRFIAEKGFPKGAVAKCQGCGKSRKVNTGEIAKWMREGFPRHCGQRITLEQP